MERSKGCAGRARAHVIAAITATVLAVAACGSNSVTSATTTTSASTSPTSTTTTAVTTASTLAGGGDGGADDGASALIGRWLGPEPGFNQGQCANGTTEFVFDTDGTWTGHNVNLDACGGTFTVGGTYSIRGRTLMLHYTRCPVSCAQFPDSSETIMFIDDNNFSMSDPSFSGTYHRQ